MQKPVADHVKAGRGPAGKKGEGAIAKFDGAEAPGIEKDQKKAEPQAKGAGKDDVKARDAKADARVKTNGVAKSKDKPKKIKMVRDTFRMPEAEYKALAEVKRKCLKAGVEVKKSQLLRAGLALIRQMDAAQLKKAVAELTPLKVGRPKQAQ